MRKTKELIGNRRLCKLEKVLKSAKEEIGMVLKEIEIGKVKLGSSEMVCVGNGKKFRGRSSEKLSWWRRAGSSGTRMVDHVPFPST